MSNREKSVRDVERGSALEPLVNATVNLLSWDGITVTVRDRETKQPKLLLDHVGGHVNAGKNIRVNWY